MQGFFGGPHYQGHRLFQDILVIIAKMAAGEPAITV